MKFHNGELSFFKAEHSNSYSFDYVGKSIWSVDGASEFEEFTPDVSVEGMKVSTGQNSRFPNDFACHR